MHSFLSVFKNQLLPFYSLPHWMFGFFELTVTLFNGQSNVSILVSSQECLQVQLPRLYSFLDNNSLSDWESPQTSHRLPYKMYEIHYFCDLAYTTHPNVFFFFFTSLKDSHSDHRVVMPSDWIHRFFTMLYHLIPPASLNHRSELIFLSIYFMNSQIVQINKCDSDVFNF